MKKIASQKFTKKEKLFIKYYSVFGVGTTAAIKAGYAKANARQQAHQLLVKPKIQKAIEKENKKQLAKVDISIEEVINQYKNLATADINNYYHIYYELKYNSTYIKEEFRTRTILHTYKGYRITPEEYDNLPLKHKKYYKEEKDFKPFEELTKGQRAAIAGITYDKYGNKVLKLSAKEKSLDALGRFLGMFEKFEEDDSNNEPQNLNVKVSFE